MMKTLTRAPALERGILILRLLQDGRARSFTDIAAITGLPRATVSRLLDAMYKLGLIQRDARSRSFSARVQLLTSTSSQRDLEAQVAPILRELSEKCGHTAEWYVPSGDSMLMANRREPSDVEISIRATIGFVRTPGPELEAVSILGQAFLPSNTARTGLWAYSRDGVRSDLSAQQVARLLSAAARRHAHADPCCNSNGIRRSAAAVVHEGQLRGILALAEFIPANRTKRRHPRANWLPVLTEAATRLETFINTERTS